MRRLSSEGTILPLMVLPFLVVAACGWLYAQKPLTVRDLSMQGVTLDGKAVVIKGILAPSHIGPLLKDESERIAVRLRFERLPRSARRERVIKDEFYRRLFDVANSIPDPDQPKAKYEVELLGLVKLLKKPSYDVYKESFIQIYPLQVLRVGSVTARDRNGVKIP